MLHIRCKLCNVELEGHSIQTKCCGCENLTTIKGDKISAVDLSQVVILNSIKENKQKNILSDSDLHYQESRRTRKVRKMDFEVR